MSDGRPVIALTMGDPGGCGPELSAKLLSDPGIYDISRPVVIGDPDTISLAARMLGIRAEVNRVRSIDRCTFSYGTIDVLDPGLQNCGTFSRCRVSAANGRAAFLSVRKAIELAMAGEADATVTNAISKEAVQLAGFRFSGHTEIYAHYTGTKNYTMMLVHDDLRVTHVSTHVSLREACDRVRKERVLEVIRLTDRACRSMGIADPRLAVAGLNPHAGENGLFGREEIEEINPAVSQARSEGIDVCGALPPDTIFSKALGGWYDAVVAMYHDQGHIPLKTVGFRYDREQGKWSSVSGVNLTLGLPIIRTSVDHGTAFDAAWKGVLSPDSLRNAYMMAVAMAENDEVIG